MAETQSHNYRAVGYSMILVAASLVVIALLYLAIGDDVLYSDRVAKQKQYEYKQFLEESKQKMEEAASIQKGKDISVSLSEKVQMETP
jgi:hypothetical protein